MKLVVSYGYFPLETLADEPLFRAVLEGVQYFQKSENREQQHLQQLEQNAAAQQQTIAALQKSIAELQAHCQAYENSLQGVLSSSSWRLTSPFRRLLGWFHRGQK